MIEVVDGTQSVPTVLSATNGTLRVAGVQLGDRLIVELADLGLRDHTAVVKNFTWNDLQRLGGIGALSFHSSAASLGASARANIKNTIQFALEPPNASNTTAQGQQRAQWCQQLNGQYAFLAIPSSRGIGMFPDDMSHWHGAGDGTTSLDARCQEEYAAWLAAMAGLGFNYVNEPENIVDCQKRSALCAVSDALIGHQLETLNMVSEITGAGFFYHTYEERTHTEVSTADKVVYEKKYADPAGLDYLLPADPIRITLTRFSSNTPLLCFPPNPILIETMPIFFVNRNGQVTPCVMWTGREKMVADALRDE
jgi:hypothetical protein